MKQLAILAIAIAAWVALYRYASPGFVLGLLVGCLLAQAAYFCRHGTVFWED